MHFQALFAQDAYNGHVCLSVCFVYWWFAQNCVCVFEFGFVSATLYQVELKTLTRHNIISHAQYDLMFVAF